MSVEIDLEGKVAVITGASKGIGRAAAIALAEAGANVVLAARTDSLLKEAAEEVRAMGRKALSVPMDVTDKRAVEKLMSSAEEQMGGLHILVNNAAIMSPGPLLDQAEEEWDRVISVNLKAIFLCTQAAGRYMVKRKYGKIIRPEEVAPE